MKEFIKKNFAVVLAFALPIVLITIVALGTYLPSLFLSTDYNFIYTSCYRNINNYPYNCGDYIKKRFSVVDGKLVVNTLQRATRDLNNAGGIVLKKVKESEIEENYSARIFLHNTKKNESREITLEEAQTLDLEGLLTSPDGVSVSSGYNRNSNFLFVFGGSSSYGQYLMKGKSRTKINLINNNDRYYYRNNFQFLGWVLPGRN